MSEFSYAAKSVTYFKYGRVEMLPFVPAGARNVLEIGCGEGEFASNLKGAGPDVRVTGVEPFLAAAQVAQGRLDRVLAVDVDAALDQLAGECFDCVVCNDVLEHLADPWAVLRSLRPLLGPRGTLVASLPNMRFMPVFKDLVLKGQWTYTNQGVMDRTHLRFFTRTGMQDLFTTCGFRVRTIEGINSIDFPWKFGLLNRLVGGALSDCRYQQFACVAESSVTYETH
jgi:2-polyprenyl-3-methyl-5-hydroxy-6-metoxy-1,4-benzoquinol methylase